MGKSLCCTETIQKSAEATVVACLRLVKNHNQSVITTVTSFGIK